MDPFIPLKKSDQIGGPWIPTFSFLKIWTDSAVRGSLHSPKKIGPNRRPVDPYVPVFKNLDRFSRSWIPAFPSKIGPNRRSVDPCIPFLTSDRFDRPWVPATPSSNSDQIGGPWIPTFSFLKIWTDLAVRGSLHTL